MGMHVQLPSARTMGVLGAVLAVGVLTLTLPHAAQGAPLTRGHPSTGASSGAPAGSAAGPSWADTPPRGWNSYDSFTWKVRICTTAQVSKCVTRLDALARLSSGGGGPGGTLLLVICLTRAGSLACINYSYNINDVVCIIHCLCGTRRSRP